MSVFRQLVEVDAAFAADSLHAYISVQHIRRRVALKAEHLLVTENVIGHAVEAQVRVLYRTDSDGSGY